MSGPNLELTLMSDCKKKVEIMEKDFIFLKGKERELLKKEYFRLLKKHNKQCGLEDPVYLKRK